LILALQMAQVAYNRLELIAIKGRTERRHTRRWNTAPDDTEEIAIGKPLNLGVGCDVWRMFASPAVQTVASRAARAEDMFPLGLIREYQQWSNETAEQ
jgi:hypothetical protein